MELVNEATVRDAAVTIRSVAVRTPVVPADWLGGGEFWLKPENLQPTGSFKVRGATYALSRLPADLRANGVVTQSSGNHGQALAYAARAAGLRCVVVMPEEAAAHKVEATRRLGAEVVLVPRDQRGSRCRLLAEEQGLGVVPPFDHPNVIAGQGTVGWEIVADLPEVDVVLVPVGGGGLASGVATAVTARRPAARVVAVEPVLAADARDSLAAGRVTGWPTELTYRTVADGLRTGLSELTLAHLRARLDRIVTVTEEEILGAARVLLRQARIVAEPSGAVAAAAYLYRRDELPPGLTVAVVSGGNLAPELLRDLAG